MKIKSRKCKKYNVFYKNDFETDFLIKEIFEGECYHFNTDNNSPLIIDCGAHIGLSVLYFKKICPASRIIAFEPDKRSFELLKKNVEFNDLKNIILYNAAVSDFEGEAVMYGDFRQNSESLGNTIIKDWGDRNGFTTYMVSTLRLSGVIGNKLVEYLKIDSEGTELSVLKDIEGYLSQVKNIYIEFHEHGSNKNDLWKIEDILKANRFKIAVSSLDLTKLLSKKYPLWVKNQQPAVHIVKGIKEA